MQRMRTQADYRLLDAVQNASVLTDAEPTETARERLRDILGYRLYRSLVVRRLVP
jgi:hypothetical protein